VGPRWVRARRWRRSPSGYSNGIFFDHELLAAVRQIINLKSHRAAALPRGRSAKLDLQFITIRYTGQRAANYTNIIGSLFS
jgi:hypothetical protein